MIKIYKKVNRLELNLLAVPMGKDICIILTGGDTPHLGAITLGSCTLNPQTSSFDTHKEGIITKMLANMLRDVYKGNFVVCCGIHLDNITQEEISSVKDLCCQMATELLEQLAQKAI